MLTESREAMNLRKSLQILAIASLSLPQLRRQPISADSGNLPAFSRPNRHRTLWSIDGPPALLVGICPHIRIKFADASDQRLPTRFCRWMLNEIIEFLQTAARSVGAEVTSPWFYLQFGLILAAAGIAYAADAAIRARVDMTSLAMRWPLPLRHFARVLVAQRLHRGVRDPGDRRARDRCTTSTWPSRSYLLAGRRQAGAGLAGDPAGHLGDPQRLHRQAGVAVGMAGRGAEHPRPARAGDRSARFVRRSCSAACG